MMKVWLLIAIYMIAIYDHLPYNSVHTALPRELSIYS